MIFHPVNGIFFHIMPHGMVFFYIGAMEKMEIGRLLPVLASALALGFYDICKKHALRDNSVMPVLFLSLIHI